MEITQEEYDSLRRDSRLLMALEAAGVDNWSGYEYVNWNFVNTGVGDATE